VACAVRQSVVTAQASVAWLLMLSTYLTRLTRTFFTESRFRASNITTGTSGLSVKAILMSYGSNRGAPSKQLTAMMNGVPLRSK